MSGKEPATDPISVNIVIPLTKFAKDSYHLVKKCTKPDRKGKKSSLL
jgi:hypothetical protein